MPEDLLQFRNKLKNLEDEFENFQFRVNRQVGPGTNKISTNNVPGARQYDAVVDAGGKGDFKGIQEAIDSGKRRIYVRSGTYVLTSDIVVPSDCAIIGEDKYNTIIDCNASDYKFTTNDPSREEYTGTISAVYGDKTITGSGTTFTNLQSGDLIMINFVVYTIDSITNDTSLEITIPYYGYDIDGLVFRAGNYNNNISILNFTVQNMTSATSLYGAINLRYIMNCTFNDLIVKNVNNGTGITFFNAINVFMSDIDLFNNYSHGLYIISGFGNKMVNINITNCGGAAFSSGIYLSTGSTNTIINCKFNNNRFAGIWSNCPYNSIVNCISNGNYYGYYGSSTSSGTNLINCNFYKNRKGVFIQGVFTKLNNSNICWNKEDGIIMNIYGSYCIISNNSVNYNGQDTDNTYSDILLEGDANGHPSYNVINGNIIKSSAGTKTKYGIREDSSSEDYNIITNNVVGGQATTTISIQGANTIKANNIE